VTDDASLAAALANAPAGATIALEAGTYRGFEVPRDMKIVGRCASKVTLKGGMRGVYVVDTRKVTVESLTVDGFEGGIVAAWGADVAAARVIVRNTQAPFVSGEAKLRITGSVVETTKPKTAALMAQTGGSIVFEDGEVRGHETIATAFEKDTDVTFRRSVARYEGSSAGATMFTVFGGAHVLVDESAVRFRMGTLAFTRRTLPTVDTMDGLAGGHLELRASHVRQSGAELDRPLTKISEGSRASLEGTTVEHQTVAAFMAGDPESRFDAKATVIRGLGQSGGMRNAVWALRGGTATIEGSAIVTAQGQALASTSEGSRLTLTRSLVTETHPSTEATAPEFGSSGIGLIVGHGAVASVQGSAIVYSRNFGVLVAAGGHGELAGTIIDGTRTGPEGNGGAALASVSAHVTMDHSLVRDSQDVAVVFVGGDGIVKRTRFVGNPVGVHLSEARIVEASAEPSTTSPGELVLFANVFEGTSTMVREAPYEAPLEPAPLGN